MATDKALLKKLSVMLFDMERHHRNMLHSIEGLRDDLRLHGFKEEIGLQPNGASVPVTKKQHERVLIEAALKRNKFNRKDAAKELEISERTLYRKINEYGFAEIGA